MVGGGGGMGGGGGGVTEARYGLGGGKGCCKGCVILVI